MNKFEQASRCWWGGRVPGGPMSDVGGRSRAVVGSLCSEVKCIMGNGHMETPSNPVNRQTRTKTLPSRNFVGRRQQTLKRRRQPSWWREEGKLAKFSEKNVKLRKFWFGVGLGESSGIATISLTLMAYSDRA